jgi:hypothetical protein
MGAQLYPSTLASIQDEVFDWTANDIVAVLMAPAFAPDFSQIYADALPDADIIGTSSPITNRTYVNQIAAGDPAAFLQLFDTRAITHAVLYQDTGDLAYSPLLAYYDSDNILGAPLISEGLDQYLYGSTPPGGFWQYIVAPLTGEINTYLLAGNTALAELEGGDIIVLPELLLSGKLTVTTQKACASIDEPDTCCRPTIRSSICE